MTEYVGGIGVDRDDHSAWRQRIDRESARLAELEEQGIGALSTYDITIACGGNTELALDESKRLVQSHITDFNRRLDALGPEPPKQATPFEMPDG